MKIGQAGQLQLAEQEPPAGLAKRPADEGQLLSVDPLTTLLNDNLL